MSETTTPKRWVNFGPDPPISSLPSDFQNCLPPNEPTSACDGIIGSADSGYGMCSDPKYQQTTYCSCVNNQISCPQTAAASCANSSFGYRTFKYTQKFNGVSDQDTCKNSPICVNILDVGGSQNIASNITQQCGVITNITKVLKTSPVLALITFILIVVLIILMSTNTSSDDKEPLLPPPPGLFEIAMPPV